MADEIDSKKLTEIQQHAKDIQRDAGQRNVDFSQYEQMYLMNWSKKADPRFANMRVTVSPDARNAVLGAIRLMVAADPIWKVVSSDDGADIERLENGLQNIWDQAGRAGKMPVHYDLIRAGIIYGRMDAAITPTAELLGYARKGGSKAQIAAAEELAETTPFLVETWNPAHGYPEWDALGLASYYRQVRLPIGQVETAYGKLTTDRSRYEPTTLNVFYDREYCAVWTDEETIMCRPHELPAIPIASQLVDGSKLFSDPAFQHQPLLYGLMRSGLWDNENLTLTVMYTAVLAMGSVPKWLYMGPPSASDPTPPAFDWDTEIVTIPNGAQFGPVANKGLLGPEMGELHALTTRTAQESTLYPQAYGAPVERGTTFSETNLLAQAGRLPLILPQRLGGWGIGDIGKTMLLLLRDGDYTNGTTLKKSDIPARFHVETKLDVKVPQDRLQQANLAKMLTEGDNPLLDPETVREDVLQITDPKSITRKIWSQRTANVMQQMRVQELIEEAQQAKQQEQMGQQGQPGMPPGMPPDQMMPPQGPPVDPSAGPMMPPGQAEQIQGMPPQMAGMMPGMGQGMVPPEMEGV